MCVCAGRVSVRVRRATTPTKPWCVCVVLYRHRHGHRNIDTRRHTQTHADRHTQTHAETHIHTHRHRQRHTDRHTYLQYPDDSAGHKLFKAVLGVCTKQPSPQKTVHPCQIVCVRETDRARACE